MATTDDVNTLSRHINVLSKRTNELGMALTQHGAYFSSYIRSANKRMDNLMKGVEDNEIAIIYIYKRKCKQLQQTYKALLHTRMTFS